MCVVVTSATVTNVIIVTNIYIYLHNPTGRKWVGQAETDLSVNAKYFSSLEYFV